MYLIRVLKGKENKVMDVFALCGIDSRKAPVGEYIVCHDPRCNEVRFHQTIDKCILGISEVNEDDARKILSLGNSTKSESLKTGDQVTISSGDYAGETGIIYNVQGNNVIVALSIYGRMKQITFDQNQLRVSSLPEWI